MSANIKDILNKLNDTVSDFPKDKCIHTIFEEQVLKTPNSVAVKSDKGEISFEELNKRANQLSHYLLKKGIGRNSIAAVSSERSIDTIVCLMSVLKCGAAYLPIDPAYPVERINYLLKDSKADLLITQSSFINIFDIDEEKLVCYDEISDKLIAERTENPQTGVDSKSPAYIIYTSGSTGNPKGVVGTHRASINRFFWMWEKYPFKENEVCCQKTSLSFVDSIWEIFGPLLKGIKLVVIGNYELKDTEKFIHILVSEKITRIVLVPSLLRVMLDTMKMNSQSLPDLYYWFSSGEELTIDLYRNFKKLTPNSKLINLYGSSEVAADVTVFDTDETGDLPYIPLGSPISNCEIFILDEELNGVPIGEDGELYVSGECLANGYLHKDELTKERFIPNPFGKYKLMYKTGDIVRCHSNGNIEYAGRADNQVKLRGFRIELGEIESELCRIEGVSESIVLMVEGAGKSDYLKAFVVPKRNEKVNPAEIRMTLAGKLPDYMIPSEFVLLDELPLTPNGKIDRNKLRSHSDGIKNQNKLVLQPENETEVEVREIWKEVLSLNEIGVTENFFEIGGHSLTATKIISRIRYSFEIEIPLKVIFDKPTIRGLSDEIIRIITEEVTALDEAEVLKQLSLQD